MHRAEAFLFSMAFFSFTNDLLIKLLHIDWQNRIPKSSNKPVNKHDVYKYKLQNTRAIRCLFTYADWLIPNNANQTDLPAKVCKVERALAAFHLAMKQLEVSCLLHRFRMSYQ